MSDLTGLWRQTGTIIELASRLEDRSPQFGKTALQKLIYLLQEIYSVDLGYEFSLYTYGPFSAQLLNDLDVAAALGGVHVEYVGDGLGGYKISPGPHASNLVQHAEKFLTDIRDSLDAVTEQFGHLTAKDLELRSTIIYVDRDAQTSGKALDRSELVRMVHQIKPGFNEALIARVLDELERNEFVAQRS